MSRAAQGPLLIIAGPTATGKSALALRLAHELNGETVSVDSMQVYRGMDIGTAKPTAAERGQISHHLIDVLDVAEPFDAAAFARLAEKAIQEIRARNHAPILCGGTGLYFNALLRGVGNSPPADPELRTQLEEMSTETLRNELERIDPKSFANIDKSNRRRLIRALEVVRLTGKSLVEQRASWSTARYEHATYFCGLGREELSQRIDVRVDAMFARGFIDEVRTLLGQGLAGNKTAMQAIGYRQIVDLLEGKASLEDTVELIKVRSRQFAKRQRTWFRHQMEGTWLDERKPVDEWARQIESQWRERLKC